jgi:hypothetical protein
MCALFPLKQKGYGVTYTISRKRSTQSFKRTGTKAQTTGKSRFQAGSEDLVAGACWVLALPTALLLHSCGSLAAADSRIMEIFTELACLCGEPCW